MMESGDHMKLDLWSEFEKLRGKISYGSKGADPSTVIKWLNELEIELPEEEISAFVEAIIKVSSDRSGIPIAPSFLLRAIENLLRDNYSKVESICDPFARIGSLILPVWHLVKPKNTFAFTNNQIEAYIGEMLLKKQEINWQIGDPLQLAQEIEHEFDIACCIPPFGARSNKTLDLLLETGENVSLKDDLGNLIIASICQKLKPDGIGIFIVPPSFFWAHRSVYNHFEKLGLSVKVALFLPRGTFAPYTGIETYLVVIKKQVTNKIFVAQLSYDLIVNEKIIANYKNVVTGEYVELGRFVEASTFKGINSILREERIEKAKEEFSYKGKIFLLGEVAVAINMGRHGDDFIFEEHPNTVYIPLVGNSEVVASVSDMKIKHQNYAQVVIDPKKTDSKFILHFLNSELGKDIRYLSRGESTIPKLNSKDIKSLYLFLPEIGIQRETLNVQNLINVEISNIMGIQNEILAIERELWSNPEMPGNALVRIKDISLKGTKVARKAKEFMSSWIETLPFPLASILRAWYATSNFDYKSKYEALLFFFEATTQFISIIHLSAFTANANLFSKYKQDFFESLQKSKLSIMRPTFGTWKFITGYYAKQARVLLQNEQDKAICSEIFSDPTNNLPEILSQKALLEVLDITNKMRNDWKGHGGVVSNKEAKSRNEQLQLELYKLQEIFADLWEDTLLIMPLNVKPRKGSFDNEIAILMGSNSIFNKDIWNMASWLDLDRLYIHKKGHTKPLELLPFIRMESSPESEKNACYFFNRYDKDGAKYVSYHYTDEAEIITSIDSFKEIEGLFKDINISL